MSTIDRAQKEKWHKIHAEAKEEFEQIPGVIAVGFGVKEVAGSLNGTVALIVYVAEKKAKKDVPVNELIPDEFKGVPTDIRVMLPNARYTPFGGQDAAPLVGGGSIRAHPRDGEEPAAGTLGYMATNGDGVDVMLSAEHVMSHTKKDGNQVYAPDWSRCGLFYYNKVGETTDGCEANVSWNNGIVTQDYFVDAAIATVNDGLTANRCIIDIASVTGSDDISSSPTREDGATIEVRKTGILTGTTTGEIEDIALTSRSVAGDLIHRLIKVRPTEAGAFTFEKTLQLRDVELRDGRVIPYALTLIEFEANANNGTITPLGDDTFTFTADVFGGQGDSGAVLVDDNDKVVGILVSGETLPMPSFTDKGKESFFGMPLGAGFGVHIGPVMEKLDISINTSSGTCSSTDLKLPEMISEIGEPLKFKDVNKGLAHIREELILSEAGRKLLSIVDVFNTEIVQLVHHDRQTMVAWQRVKGPGYLALLLKCASDYGRPFPKKVKNIPVEVILTRMFDVLMETSGASLRMALQENKELLFYLLLNCDNMQDCLQEIRQIKIHQND